MAYGDKRDYPKIDIYYNQDYVGSTTWAATCREARERYAKASGKELMLIKCYKANVSRNLFNKRA